MVNVVGSEVEEKVLDTSNLQNANNMIDNEDNIWVLKRYKEQCKQRWIMFLDKRIEKRIDSLKKETSSNEKEKSEAQNQHTSEMSDLKKEEENRKKELLSELVSKLNDDWTPVTQINSSNNYQKSFDTFLLAIRNDLSSIREAYDFVFKNYKGDLSKIKVELQKLRKMELDLSKNLQKEIPKYPHEKIATLPFYTSRLIPEKRSVLVDGKKQDVWLAPERLKFKNKFRTRNRLNKTIKAFNDIWNNPDKAMRYFLTKTSWYLWGTMTKGLKMLFWTVEDKLTTRIQSLDSLDKNYEKMKQKFIDNLVWNKSDFDANEKKAIFSLQKRLDYYYAQYKRKHYNWV